MALQFFLAISAAPRMPQRSLGSSTVSVILAHSPSLSSRFTKRLLIFSLRGFHITSELGTLIHPTFRACRRGLRRAIRSVVMNRLLMLAPLAVLSLSQADAAQIASEATPPQSAIFFVATNG